MPQVERVTDQPDVDHRAIRQHPAVDRGFRAGEDDECGAERRQQRPPAGKCARGLERCRRHNDEDETEPASRVVDFLPVPLIERGETWRRQFGERVLRRREGDDAADHQFPEAREGKIERLRRVGLGQHHVPDERAEADQRRHQQRAVPPSPHQHDQRRPDDVELLFDAERPQMQQRLVIRRSSRSSRLPAGTKSSRRSRRPRRVLAEVAILAGKHHDPADCQAGGDHHDQRGEDALDAPRIEIHEAEVAVLLGAENQAGDQEAGDDEEDIDAGEAAGHLAREGVERHDQAGRQRRAGRRYRRDKGASRQVFRGWDAHRGH